MKSDRVIRGRRFPARRRVLGPAALLGCSAIAIVAARGAGEPGEGSGGGDAADEVRIELPTAIEFNRDIRPILSDRCFVCHGHDGESRQAGLRLDQRAAAIAPRGQRAPAIVPGDPTSALVGRIRSLDPEVVMPPPELKKPLDERQKLLLEAWVAQGAPYEEHWSFVPAARSQPPILGDGTATENPIDAFIRARLEREALAPMPRADRETQIRRVTLDLIGLPPTLEAIDTFVDDPRPDAYERVVDQLLADPRFGEHKARYWLDAARYADTHGLHLDNERSMWKYRDWVIDAMNRNVPFDAFTIEQLAGDLLEEPTIEQLVASGFNRCHVTTSEGGAIDAEYLVKYAADRTETMATIWLGLTVGCASCHDHKYDPISQREYYQLFAFFNNTTEAVMDGNIMSPPPVIQVPTASEEAQLSAFTAKLAAIDAEFASPPPAVATAFEGWREENGAAVASLWSVLAPHEVTAINGSTFEILEDRSIVVGGEKPPTDSYEIVARLDEVGLRAVGLEALLDESMPGGGPGRAYNGNFVLSEVTATAISTRDPAQRQELVFVSARADHEQEKYPIAHAINGRLDDGRGWASLGDDHPAPRRAVLGAAEPFGFEGGTELRLQLHFVSVHEQHAFGRFRFSVSSDEEVVPAALGAWTAAGPFAGADRDTVFATDFGPEPGDVESADDIWRDFEAADGVVVDLGKATNAAMYLRRTLQVASPRRMTLALGSDDAIKVWLDDVVVHENLVDRGAAIDQDRVELELSAGTHELLLKVVNRGGPTAFAFRVVDEQLGPVPTSVAMILARPEADRTEDERRQLREHYLRRSWDRGAELTAFRAEIEARRAEVTAGMASTLISRERDERRMAYVLQRGAYDHPGDAVEPGVPAVLPALGADAGDTRLDLARWLVDPEHPLTARVTVNRIWQEYFGTGLVGTSEDFGSQGGMPSHPELLDFLATWFIDHGWDVKALHGLIVTSETYRQSARVEPVHLARDPENRLLARGPRYRLDAETIRDLALYVSGTLVERMGGPGVKPYQPLGLWKAVGYTRSNTANFVQDTGEDLYRRSVYTFWKRTSPPPPMTAFDAPTRETCTVRRERTNTPLAALVVMNEIGFVEASRHFAERIMRDGGSSPEARVDFAFRLVTARRPTSAERAELLAFYEEQLVIFAGDEEAALGLLSVGDSPRDEALPAGEHAAWTMVANLILNLDESITKG